MIHLLLAGVTGFAVYAPAESALVARQKWTEVRSAIARQDTVAARAGVKRAHDCWPGQWFYAYAQAWLAAAQNDSPTTTRALDDLVRVGAGPDLATDTTITTLAANDPTVAAALARVAAERAPLVRSQAAVTFPAADSTFYPEGVGYDPKSKRFFVASVREGKVAAVDKKGNVSTFVTPGSNGLLAALAVAADPKRKLLWVTSAGLARSTQFTDADSGKGAILAFDLETGAPREKHEMAPNPAGHVPGDVLLARDGTVYVSDSGHAAIYRIRPGTPADAPAEEWLAAPTFRSLQGQALSDDDSTLYVSDYSHGIAAVDVATRSVRWLEPPPGGAILGFDGLARHGKDLVGVQNGMPPGRVARLVLDGQGANEHVARVEVVDRNTSVADEPTIGVVDGDDFVYVANSAWEKYDDAGKRVPGRALAPPVLLRVSLKGGK